jgi:hypothetical protein
MHLHRKINAARRNAVSRRAWRCVKLFEHDQWHRTVRGHWFKGGTAVQCATFAALSQLPWAWQELLAFSYGYAMSRV